MREMSKVIPAIAVLIAAMIGPASAEQDLAMPYQGAHCATTMLGDAARPPAFSEASARRLTQDLQIAEAMVAIAPDREDSYIWLGRRLSYLGRLCEAIDAFSQGIAAFPESYKLHRFRGQTHSRVRAFDLAIADFERAAALAEGAIDSYEPDGAPNAQNLALGTYKSNIYYYWAHAQFGAGDYRGLVINMQRSLAQLAPHIVDEHRIATTYWSYMALMKQGDARAARRLLSRLPDNIPVVEADGYYEAVRLLQGRRSESQLGASRDPIIRFAIAMQRRFNGDETGAQERLRALIADTPNGYWPAEAELAAPRRGQGS